MRQQGGNSLRQRATAPRVRALLSGNVHEWAPDGNSLADDWPADFLERPDDPSQPPDRKFVVALARGLALLRAFENAGEALGNQELASATCLPKATVTRLTFTLTRLGYLSLSPVLGKYQLGPASLALGHMASFAMRIRGIAEPHLQQFADHAGLSTGLGMRNGLDMVLIVSCHSANTITQRHDTGARIPMAVTSMGRAFLAELPADERAYLMNRLACRYRARWPKLKKAIGKASEELKENGFCSSSGEWIRDVSGVGVPLRLREGLFAINSGGPAFQVDRKHLVREVGPELALVAQNIRRAAGQ